MSFDCVFFKKQVNAVCRSHFEGLCDLQRIRQCQRCCISWQQMHLLIAKWTTLIHFILYFTDRQSKKNAGSVKFIGTSCHGFLQLDRQYTSTDVYSGSILKRKLQSSIGNILILVCSSTFMSIYIYIYTSSNNNRSVVDLNKYSVVPILSFISLKVINIVHCK